MHIFRTLALKNFVLNYIKYTYYYKYNYYNSKRFKFAKQIQFYGMQLNGLKSLKWLADSLKIAL